MADNRPTETTAFGDGWRKYSNEPIKKGNVDVFPQQFTLRCRNIEIISEDGTSRTTKILIDGKQANGVYDLHIHFNSKRLPEIKLSAYLGLFNFELKEKK